MPHLAIVMPAFNEADGLPAFLNEIRRTMLPVAWRLSILVVNDCSTDNTAVVLEDVERTMPELVVVSAPVNRGHGPTALHAYREGMKLGVDAVIHVDGDGQFDTADFPRLLHALMSDHVDVVHGVRFGRSDPWFRKVVTALVGVVVAFTVGRRVPDVNTPLRAYRPAALARLLSVVPDDAIIPHVHFSIAEKRLGLTVRYARVHSTPRRGATESGTMWGEQKKGSLLPPQRLSAFVGAAARELWAVSLRPGAPARNAPRP